MQVEDRGANLLDYLLEIVYAVRQPLLHFGGPRARDGSLQSQSDGEEALNNVVVEVPCDAIPIGQDVEFTHPALRTGQLPRQRGLVSECGHHVELVSAERLRADAP